MPKLVTNRAHYDVDAFKGWIRRRRNALSFPEASADFARLLKRKARGRSTRSSRFFGEGYVASRTPHREAYYTSFKWLTSAQFVSEKKLRNRDQERFRGALHDHFGPKLLQRLQIAVRALSIACRDELDGKTATAPDLWLVDKRGGHRFIEVKLPGDSVAPHQLAGMAAIACVLGRTHRVSVEVVYLQDDDRMFKAFCRALNAG